MRYLVMHKNDPRNEAEQKAPKEFIDRMGVLIGELQKTGRYVGGAGLRGSASRTRLTFRDGRCTMKHGPYRGEHELAAAMLQLKVRTRDEALGWAERYGKILGTCEIELGQVLEPWEIGLMPAPENPPPQFLLIEKADEATEGGGGRTPKQKADLTRLQTEMTKAGVLVKSLRLQPSAKAKRLVGKNDDLMVIDGPFTESKELLAGFAMLELTGIDEALDAARRYAGVFGGTLEVDLRTVDPGE